MILSGTVIGLVSVVALLVASLLIAFLDRKEKKKGNTDKAKFLSRLALILFIAAFVGGVVITLAGGIQPRNRGSLLDTSEGSGFAGPERIGGIGSINEQEFAELKLKVEKDPKDLRSRERLGHLYLQSQDFENVFRMAHEALQIDPQSAESRVHMGMVLNAMGQTGEALSQFDLALGADPKNLEALLFKGIVQYQTDNLKGAKTTWERFMKIAKPTDTGYERVQMFLQNINELLK